MGFLRVQKNWINFSHRHLFYTCAGVFFDSVDVLELIVELDNKFGIKVQDDDIIEEKLKTFQSFFDFIKEKQK